MTEGRGGSTVASHSDLSARPAVLVLLAHYLPGYRMGGPLRSVLSLVEHFGAEFDFSILTSDRDLGDTMPYPGVTGGGWQDVGGARVYYAAPTKLGLRGLAGIIGSTPHDLLYLNSFFSPRFAVLPLIARRLGLIPRRPTLLAPRGEFSAGAMNLMRWKKRPYVTVARASGLLKGVHWHASTSYEAEDIRRELSVSTRAIHVAANLPAALSADRPVHATRGDGEPLRIAFLSRISPKKNLDYALHVLALVRSPVSFSIYGPEENATYAARCRAIARGLPPHVVVNWRGPVPPAEVAATLAAHDLFFLPTRGENFGHVIAESLGAGTPVLISDTTPWRGLAAAGVGDDLPLAAPEAFAAVIDAAAADTSELALQRRARAHQYALRRQNQDADVIANRLLFRTALGTSR